ncbi:MAG: hypothetical protein KAH77_04370, partial [Thiomargarita sp.]|nr:hypothetical protein [Thiomargarita sp.]
VAMLLKWLAICFAILESNGGCPAMLFFAMHHSRTFPLVVKKTKVRENVKNQNISYTAFQIQSMKLLMEK